MPTLPALPVELWHQILSYVVTPTSPVQVKSWSNSQPVLQFAPEDADVQRSFTFFTGPTSISSLSHYGASSSPSRDNWPYPRGKEVPYAQDLQLLQDIFEAQVKRVDIVISAYDYWQDGEFIEKMSYALGSAQWAAASTNQVSAVLAQCKALRSLRVYYVDNKLGTMDVYSFYRSHPFNDLWAYTAPDGVHRGAWKPVADWKAECRRRKIEFKIIARKKYASDREEDDITAFWEIPEDVIKDPDMRDDWGLSWAIEAHAVRKEKDQAVELPSGA